jgi:hypothetical protein
MVRFVGEISGGEVLLVLVVVWKTLSRISKRDILGVPGFVNKRPRPTLRVHISATRLQHSTLMISLLDRPMDVLSKERWTLKCPPHITPKMLQSKA